MRTHHFHQRERERERERERKREREREALSVNQIILCRIVPVQFLFIMSENLSEPKYPWKCNKLTRVNRTI